MIIVKKSVVLTRTDGDFPGLLKLEHFAGKTTGVLNMHCPSRALIEITVDGNNFSAPAGAPFNMPFPLSPDSTVAARVVKDGGIIALSSPAPRAETFRAVPSADSALPPQTEHTAAPEPAAAESAKSGDEASVSEPEAESLSSAAAGASPAVTDEPSSLTTETDVSREDDLADASGKNISDTDNPVSGDISQKEEAEAVRQDTRPSDEPRANTAPERSEKAAARQPRNSATTGRGKSSGKKCAFMDSIRSCLDELFATYGPDEELNELVPFSRWVRIETQGGGYYVVGVINDSEGKPQFLCYGIPDKDDSQPPADHPDCRGWLPVEEGGRGYWVMYQDLNTGRIITR